MSEAITGELDLGRIADYLTSSVAATMRLEKASIWLRDREGWLERRGRRDDRLSPTAALRRVLRQEGKPSDLEEISLHFADDESEEFRERLLGRGLPAARAARLPRAAHGRPGAQGEALGRALRPRRPGPALDARQPVGARDRDGAPARRDDAAGGAPARPRDRARHPDEPPAAQRARGARASRSSAAVDPGAVVGGDFYDFIPFEDRRLGVVIGDVSGKSVPASLLMVASKEIVYSRALTTSDPGAALPGVQPPHLLDQAAHVRLARFLPARPGRHEPALRHRRPAPADPAPRRATADPRLIEPPEHRLPLGAFREVPYDTRELFLRRGDLLFFYTDGFTEAMDAEMNPYGEERLMASAGGPAGGDPRRGRPGGPGRHPGPRRGGRAVRRHDFSVSEGGGSEWGGVGGFWGISGRNSAGSRHPYEGVRGAPMKKRRWILWVLGLSPPARGRGCRPPSSVQPPGRDDDAPRRPTRPTRRRSPTRAASTSRRPASAYAKALELDPSFAMAMLGLARQSERRRPERSRSSGGPRSEKDRLTERERLPRRHGRSPSRREAPTRR